MLFIKKNFICKESGSVTKVRSSDTSETRVTQMQHECNTSDTSKTQVLH